MTDETQQTDIVEPSDALPPITLAELSEKQSAATKRAGWGSLTPVQSKAIPYFGARRDLMVQARTGSGKTGAFILPMLDRLDFSKDACQALVLVPTRELAKQVAAEAEMLAGDAGMRLVAVYGGVSYKPQLDAFKKGAHLVVGTPGRVLDHLLKRNLKLDNLELLIFDEADRMLSMGFLPDMVRVQEFLPDRAINAYMFSATIPAPIQRLAQRFLNDAGFLSLSRDQVHVEDVDHVYYITPGMDKDRALVRLIEMENPHQTIIFCNTKDRVFYVTQVLQRFGYNADQLSSDLSQNAREKVLKRLREGKLRFLVATDVAARGIDIPDLSHVIQFEPPDDLEAYIHRAGRTGRAGASGSAIMLITYNEKKMLDRIAGRYSIEFEERPLPQDEDVQALVAQRLVGQLEGKLRERDKLQTERMQRFLPLVEELNETNTGRQLLAMLLDDSYHDWMHDAPDMSEISKPQPKQQRKQGGGDRGRGGRGRRGGDKRRGGGGRRRDR
ncbi:MAG: ATP-dependent helicase [Chloroflexi bacterium]|nr:MAG: ATP-dependent helicase [Chloroflexota bacterium]MBL1195410.1 DEAD/DEAH box helicase [Chloroflexota bacterium]NOH12693.1 DEAD/DEAH box helicase [Chloroflexota bacterium]